MINSFNTKILFILIFCLILSLISMNYLFKIPNDGVLYLTSAKFFLENNTIINPTKSIGGVIQSFPTSQIGITIYLTFLIFFFKKLWIFVYAIFFSIVWVILIKKLYKLASKNFNKNKFIVFLFPFLIFFNYDYLISSASFYNETLYYPFLIFCFLKIINSIQKQKSIFYKSNLFIFFLAIGTIFRVQHLFLLAALSIFFLLDKKNKEFFYILILGTLNIAIILIIINFLKSFETSTNQILSIERNSLLDFLLSLKVFFNQFSGSFDNWVFDNTNIFFKNLKIQLSLYSNFLNLPKIVNFSLPNIVTSAKEMLYAFTSFFIILILVIYLKLKKFDKITFFLLSYFVLNSIFLFFLSDITTRYFLLTNFCIIYFLCDFFKKFKPNLNIKLFNIGFIIIFFIILSFYGSNYFLNNNKNKNTYYLTNILKEFDENRMGYYDENDIFISKYNYHIMWINKKPSLGMREFLALNNIDHQKRYFFVGIKAEIFDPQYSMMFKKVKKVENYSYRDISENKPGVWRIYFK